MYSVVKVLEVNDDSTVLVGCDTNACQGCKAEMFCNTKEHSTYLALNFQKLPIKPGDFIEIYLPPKKTILSTILVFALPLILFPLGFVLARNVGKLTELSSALVGLVSMGLAFCITSVISTKNKKALMPQISKVL